MAWDDIDWSKPDRPKNSPPQKEKEKRPWDGIDSSDRTRGKCRSCGISPENVSVSTGNCYNCDDNQPQLFDRQLNPTEIHGSVHSSLANEAGLKDVPHWLSEKGIDIDASIHKKIYPSGCPDENCWICHEGTRPVGFDAAPSSVHDELTT